MHTGSLLEAVGVDAVSFPVCLPLIQIAILTDLQVVQLGDIIDGCNSKLQASETALKRVLEVLSRS